MDRKRPLARIKNITSVSNGVHRRGGGLRTGFKSDNSSTKSYPQLSGKRRAAVGGGISLPLIVGILYLIVKLIGSDGTASDQNPHGDILNTADSGGYSASESGEPDNSVASGSREKRTNILGDGKDQVTVMVYMCGTDLESESGMASADIEEMAEARFGDNVNLLIYTGGCTDWKISGISNRANQIFQLRQGNIVCLMDNMGNDSMTNPKTLSSFINYCNDNFPANRNNLILWDHGGGSVSGYGYDQRHKTDGSMSLADIDKALSDSNVKFDFIGFDACLMATAETALMLDKHADYMIASEETEPGIGWYYKNWLTKLGRNSSLSTLDVGKIIVDDFVSTCSQKCPGQKTTLSVVDLAEFSATVPPALSDFAKSISSKLTNQEYQEVSDARYLTREFAKNSRIDQVDLVNLSDNMNIAQGNILSRTVRKAVKYNRTSSNITNAYGVSIYFPYQRTSDVDRACETYSKIGIDAEYSNCIRQFASIETSGQIASGGMLSPLSSLLGTGVSPGSSASTHVISELISGFLKGNSDKIIPGIDQSNSDFLKDSPLSENDTALYIASNSFNTGNLVWQYQDDKKYTISLPESQWILVHKLDKNMFLDDGEGFIDLGLDNVYSFDGDGDLIADTDHSWISINSQIVSYYHTDTIDNGEDYTISGYVPILLNGNRADLLLSFDNHTPEGFVAGANMQYKDGETQTIAKNFTEIKVGDTIDFISDYYSYNGEFIDSYLIGEQITVTDGLRVTDTLIENSKVKIAYCFTDIYNQKYWTETIPD